MSSENTTSISGVDPGEFIGDRPPNASFRLEVLTPFHTSAAARISLMMDWNVSPGIIALGPCCEIR